MENFRVQKAGGQKWNKIKGLKALSEGRRKGKTRHYTGWKVHRIVHNAESTQGLTAKNWYLCHGRARLLGQLSAKK